MVPLPMFWDILPHLTPWTSPQSPVQAPLQWTYYPTAAAISAVRIIIEQGDFGWQFYRMADAYDCACLASPAQSRAMPRASSASMRSNAAVGIASENRKPCP